MKTKLIKQLKTIIKVEFSINLFKWFHIYQYSYDGRADEGFNKFRFNNSNDN